MPLHPLLLLRRHYPPRLFVSFFSVLSYLVSSSSILVQVSSMLAIPRFDIRSTETAMTLRCRWP